MPIKQRAETGRATSRFSTRDLYEVVRAVAEHANPDDPASVSQRRWDAARAGAGYPDAPTARCITMRLRTSRDGQVYPWPQLLERVFDPAASIDQVEVRRETVAVNSNFTLRHVDFALRAVSKRLNRTTLSPDEYERGRAEMLAAEQRRRGHLLSELLPTPAQIRGTVMRCVEAIGSEGPAWDYALQLAELDPTLESGRKGKPGRNAQTGVLSMVEAIHYYFEAGNSLEFWPPLDRMKDFGGLADVRIQRPHGRPWADVLAEAAAYRAERGLPHPTRSRPTGGQQRWEPVKPPSEPIPGAKPKRTAHARRPYTDEELWAAVERYYREAPAGERHTQVNYRRFAKANALPAASLLPRIGGLRKAMAEVRRKALADDTGADRHDQGPPECP